MKTQRIPKKRKKFLLRNQDFCNRIKEIIDKMNAKDHISYFRFYFVDDLMEKLKYEYHSNCLIDSNCLINILYETKEFVKNKLYEVHDEIVKLKNELQAKYHLTGEQFVTFVEGFREGKMKPL